MKYKYYSQYVRIIIVTSRTIRWVWWSSNRHLHSNTLIWTFYPDTSYGKQIVRCSTIAFRNSSTILIYEIWHFIASLYALVIKFDYILFLNKVRPNNTCQIYRAALYSNLGVMYIHLLYFIWVLRTADCDFVLIHSSIDTKNAILWENYCDLVSTVINF